MCSTVAKGYLCKSKRQCPWVPYLALGVHIRQLILINAVDLRGWYHRLDDRHDTLAHVAVYVEWKIILPVFRSLTRLLRPHYRNAP